MTGRYILSPAAQDDLDGIWDFSARRWGVEQAEVYIRQLWHDIEIIARSGRADDSVNQVIYLPL